MWQCLRRAQTPPYLALAEPRGDRQHAPHERLEQARGLLRAHLVALLLVVPLQARAPEPVNRALRRRSRDVIPGSVLSSSCVGSHCRRL
jgi:hypothetical protein